MSKFFSPPRRSVNGVMPGRRVLVGAVGWLPVLAALVGCGTLPSALRVGEPTGPENSDLAQAMAQRSADELRAALADATWIEAPTSRGPSPPMLEIRWRHRALESLALDTEAARQILRQSLVDSNPVVAGNAAISLARQGDAAAVEVLAATARATSLDLPLRRAATEMLGWLAEPQAGESLRNLVETFGGPADVPTLPRQPELYVEALRALARHQGPCEPAHRAALRSQMAEARFAAVWAWQAALRDGRIDLGRLPEEFPDLRQDPDPRVRAAVLAVVAAARLPDAGRQLAAALTDEDHFVRIAAIEGLASVGDDSARETLRSLAAGQSDLIRAAAVAGLARLGDWPRVLTAADDQSWRVRLAVAAALADHPHRETRELVERLLVDASSQVQQQAIESLDRWPREAAGPLWLLAMERSGYLPRKSAAAQLARTWPAAQVFMVDAPPERRQIVIDQLRKQWLEEWGPDPLAQAAAERAASLSRPAVDAARLGELLGALADPQATADAIKRTCDELVASGPPLVEALEVYTRQSPRTLPPLVYERVLPRLGPEWSPLAYLDHPDAARRVQALSELVPLARQGTLPEFVVAHLAARLERQVDPHLWTAAMQLVEGDPRAAARRLASMAVSHPSGDLRRRACDYLGRFYRDGDAALVLPALSDSDAAVVKAALRALRHPQSNVDPGALEQLLAAADRSLRVEAARTLAELGFGSGRDALERLARDPDQRIRMLAAQAMGELGDPRFETALRQLMQDPPGSVRRAASAALAALANAPSAAEGAPPDQASEERLTAPESDPLPP